MDELDDLGPLPESDENSLLQAESFKALENALPTDRFVLRHEPQPDAGVDWCVELRIAGRYTGMRAHVQVKARADKKANSDGSVSFSADVNNVNYLLNGLRPLYVLYIAETKEIRYAWVRDEVNRIQKATPGWMRQKTVTLRFVTVLDELGLNDIHGRIRRESRMDRQIHDILSRADVTEKTIHVSMKDSKVTDPDDLRDLLMNSGITLVSHGNGENVLRAIERLAPLDRQHSRILLIRAFAEQQIGRYQLADGHLIEAGRRPEGLADRDREFFGVLRDICHLKLGRISKGEYIARQTRWAEGTSGDFSLSRRIDSLRLSLFEDAKHGGLTASLSKLREAVGRAMASPGASEQLRLQARIALAHGEGVRLFQEYVEGLGDIESRAMMGLSSDADNLLSALGADLGAWVEEVNGLVTAAREMDSPHLLGDALLVRSSILFARCSYALSKLPPDSAEAFLGTVRDGIASHARIAVECFEACGNLEWGLRASLLLADVLDLIGDRQAAVVIASNVLPEAEAYEYDAIAVDARDHLAGRPFFRQMQSRLASLRGQDPDLLRANESDDRTRRFAEDMLGAMRLPRERLPQVINEALAKRDISKERVNWCRYIDLMARPPTIDGPLMAYAVEPDRCCRCMKFGVRSKIESPDWLPVIEAFKRNYCKECSSRSPKARAETEVGSHESGP